MTKAITGADDILRGVRRALADADHAVLAEVPLGNGRRADLVAIDCTGMISLVEIKSCRADFLTDRKCYQYLDYCDRFYFAVAARSRCLWSVGNSEAWWLFHSAGICVCHPIATRGA